MKHRPERFGAWVRVDDGTLVAVDHALARSLGVTGAAPVEPLPLEVHVAVTSRCPAGCTGCYQSATRDGEDVSIEELARRLDELAKLDVFTVAFGGGEPAMRDDLGQLATMARARGLVPVVTTSGIGLTRERAATLHDFAQVNVSHDGVGGGYEAVRGFDGALLADRAVRTLVALNIPVGINHVLTRDNYPLLADTVRHVRALGAREIQLLRYKPAGRAASLDYLAKRLSPSQVRALGPTLEALANEHSGALSLRVDCAMVSLLSDTFTDVAMLSRFGVFGCEAGRNLGAVRRDGTLAGCSFVTHAPPSTESLATQWSSSPELERFRGSVRAPSEPCASCSLRSVCRGGCRIVSEHLTGGFAPDPECPRVRAYKSSTENAP